MLDVSDMASAFFCQYSSTIWLDVQAAEYLPNQLFNTIPSLHNRNLVNLFGRYLSNRPNMISIACPMEMGRLLFRFLSWRAASAGRQ